MAEEDGQEKTEEPSEKRLEDARDEGQIAKTQELGVFLTLATSMMMLNHWGPTMGMLLQNSLRDAFVSISKPHLGAGLGWAQHYVMPLFNIVMLFSVALLVINVASSLFQTGLVFTWKSMSPKFESINPYSGFKKLFSMKMVVQFIKNFLKVAIIGWIVYSTIKADIGTVIYMTSYPIVETLRWCAATVANIVLKVSIFLATLTVFDYLYQWYTIHQSLMMTRQEMKDEYKQSQLPENVRSKVRQVANERSKRKIHKEVPNADVIITNPTHFAVAIKYQRFVDRAPRVVAKGQDLLAHLIRSIANEHKVPIYEYPVLARKLYRTVKVGETIPADLYESVAKVLAFVYKLYRERKVVRI